MYLFMNLFILLILCMPLLFLYAIFFHFYGFIASQFFLFLVQNINFAYQFSYKFKYKNCKKKIQKKPNGMKKNTDGTTTRATTSTEIKANNANKALKKIINCLFCLFINNL